MDALDVLKVCLRRWYVVVPVILLALGAGLGLAWQQKPTYRAFASYALVYQTAETSTQANRDPRLANPLGVNQAALLGEALAADFMSAPAQATLGREDTSGVAPGEADKGTSYVVALPEGGSQITLSYLVQSWGKDPDALRAVVDSVIRSAPVRAGQIQDQAGAPKKSQYTVFVAAPTQVVTLPPTSTLKLVIALLGVGILAGSALALVIDRAMRSRKKRLHPPKVVSWASAVEAPAADDSDVGFTTENDVSIAASEDELRDRLPTH